MKDARGPGKGRRKEARGGFQEDEMCGGKRRLILKLLCQDSTGKVYLRPTAAARIAKLPPNAVQNERFFAHSA